MSLSNNATNRLRYAVYAPIYDFITRPFERARKRSIELLALRPQERVLIIGAGTGLDMEFLPADVEITAGDISPAMLNKAEKRARKLGLNAQVRPLDAHALDLDDDSFDAVILHLVLAVVPDPHACIREAARVLKPDGRLVVFDKFLPDHDQPSLARKITGWLADALFSDINRQLGPLLDEAGLQVMHEEPSMMGGAYKIVLAGC
jgi:ubiquinone/menaquinone biosynthesis C-methylase UbiE